MALKRYFVLIGLVLFVFILATIDLHKMLSILLQANFLFLVLAFSIVLVCLLMKALKWFLIIRAHGVHCSFGTSLSAWCAGFFVSVFTPGRIGDFVRGFYLKDRAPLATGFSTVLIDRLIDVTLLLFLAFFAILGFAFIFGIEVISLEVISLIVVAFIALVFLFLKQKYIKFLLTPFFRFLIPEKFKSKLHLNFNMFYASLYRLKKKKLILAEAILVGILIWFSTISVAYLVALSLHLNAPFYFFVLVIPIITLVELIPVTVSGFGTREAAAIFLFSFYSVSSEQAVAFSLLYWIIAYLSVIFIGFLCFIRNPIDFRNIIKNA